MRSSIAALQARDIHAAQFLLPRIAHREITAQGLRHPCFTAIQVDNLPSEIGLPEPAGEDADPH
ncbi:hypothetical protein ABZ540_36335 [Nocardia xishanensis]|uniref:hypothetical protein n=1 Tax=Nocardia xishanensis TaxID=238964 RepID=UPI0033CF8085